ncbi:MAG: hypothetical protein ACR2KU_00165 [Gammaproteobacteria bacterium]
MAQAYLRRTNPLLPAVANAMLFGCVVFAPSTAAALDFTVQPRINTGAMYYELDVENSISVDDTLPFVGGGVTAFVDRFYVDLYAQGAFSGDDALQQSQGVDDPSGATIDWDRAEYSASAGVAVTDRFSVFAGYRRSDMGFNLLSGDSDVALFDYQNEGPFVGANYGLPININEWLNGTLALNVAVARFDGEIDFSNAEVPDITGDTVGYTAGAAWIGNLIAPADSGLFANGLNYTIGVDGYSYNFDQDNVDPGDPGGDEISETVIRGSVGLSVPFNL